MFSRTDLAQCRMRGCGMAIMWTTTERGKMLAVNADPARDGNTAVWKDAFGVLRSRLVTKARPRVGLEKLMKPHATSCFARQPRTAADDPPPRQPPPRPPQTAPAAGELYERLGVARTATAQDITKAYRRLARELHPDLNPDPGATERFKKVTEAHDVLSDPRRRATYDVTGRRPTPR